MTKRDPVIVINLHTIAHHFKQDPKDAIIGCRLTTIRHRYENFLQNLKHAGVELIFVFKKTDSVKDSKFTERYKSEYARALELIYAMKSSNDLDQLLDFYKNEVETNPFAELPLNEAVFFVLCQTAQRYGRIHGIDAYKASKFHIDLAKERNAMAVIGLNSNYFLYDGSWAFWSDRDLDMEAMTTIQYDREIVMRHLNISYTQAPLFAALTGGLRSYKLNKDVYEYFQPWEGDSFENVSDFVNQQRFPITDSCLAGMIKRILGKCDSSVIKDFQESIESMSSKQIEADVMKSIRDDPANLAEEILEGSTIFISPVYLDER
jgi:hypothetical protein